MFKKLKYLYALLGIGAVVALSTPAHAANLALPTPSGQNLSGNSDTVGVLGNIGSTVINVIFLLAGILAVIYLLWSGVQYITAGGNPDKVKAARQGIINAVIGVVVIMAAFFIVRIATSTRGLFDNNGNAAGGGFGGGGGGVGQ